MRLTAIVVAIAVGVGADVVIVVAGCVWFRYLCLSGLLLDLTSVPIGAWKCNFSRF